MLENVMRRDAVEKATGLSRSTIYELMSRGEFPRPIKLSARAVGWLASDIGNWLQERRELSVINSNQTK